MYDSMYVVREESDRSSSRAMKQNFFRGIGLGAALRNLSTHLFGPSWIEKTGTGIGNQHWRYCFGKPNNYHCIGADDTRHVIVSLTGH